MLIALFLAAAFSAPAQTTCSIRPARDPFVSPARWASWYRFERIDELKRELGQKIPEEYLDRIFCDQRIELYPPRSIRVSKVNWSELEQQMLAPESVQRGLEFRSLYRETLERTTEAYGVPWPVIVALIRIETNLGDFLHEDPEENPRTLTFNIFYSQAVRAWNPKWRRDLATLGDLVGHCYANGHDCLEIRGFWAGAIGYVQFMPFNLDPYGVDGNDDGVVDLFDPEDAIPSAASFLADRGCCKSPEGRRRALRAYYGEAGPYQTITLAYEEKLRRAVLESNKPRASK